MKKLICPINYILLLFGLTVWLLGCNLSYQKSTEKPTWRYTEEADEMGRGRIKRASITSINTVSLKSPYEGPQHAKLWLRKHPRLGESVALSIERGQFLAGVYRLQLLVRFDDNAPLTFYADEPESLSTTTVFIDEYPKFLKYLKLSKKVKIEAPFYDEGRKVFEFDVEGLNWDAPRDLL
jgi:hypothetical protein